MSVTIRLPVPYERTALPIELIQQLILCLGLDSNQYRSPCKGDVSPLYTPRRLLKIFWWTVPGSNRGLKLAKLLCCQLYQQPIFWFVSGLGGRIRILRPPASKAGRLTWLTIHPEIIFVACSRIRTGPVAYEATVLPTILSRKCF